MVGSQPARFAQAEQAPNRRRGHVAGGPQLVGTFAERLEMIDADIARYLDDLEVLLADKNGPVRLDEHGELHLSPLAAEVVDPTMLAERGAVIARLPALPLTELLIETDLEASWSKHLTHAGGAKPRVPEIEHRRNLYAAILTQACNYGTTRMAELTGDLRRHARLDDPVVPTRRHAAPSERRHDQRPPPPPPRGRLGRRDAVVLRRAAAADARQVADG